MSKRGGMFRSSSMGRSILDDMRPAESPIAQWQKKHTAAAAPISAQKLPTENFLKQPALEASAKNRWTSKSIFAFSSPPRDEGRSEDKIDKRFGCFLEACALCKKKLEPNDEVFMYGYLQAFCSPECREDQMATDRRLGLLSPEPNPGTNNPAIAAIQAAIIRTKKRLK